MDHIKKEIMQKLKETEINYKVKIPFAIESGSRGWGFASPDSDYDCRFIYVNHKDWYLSVFEKKDIIEYAADKIFDTNGWDLKKVLQHIMKSNAVMFEWLSSNEVYIRDKFVTDQLQSLAEKFFNPIAVSYHYLSIAKNKLGEILSEDEAKLKKYFYILRPIANLEYIYKYRKMPYMEYDRTLGAIDMDASILAEIEKLKKIKITSDESFKIPQNKLLIDYFKSQIDVFSQRLNEMQFTKNKEYQEVDLVFRAILEKLWSNE